MSVNKSLLASAVAAGLLFSASASAVELGVDPARIYAQELTKPFNITDADDDAVFALGYNFSDGEVRYGRFECTDNLVINSPTVSSSSADMSVGAVNGAGTPALFFSLTAGTSGATSAITLTVDANNQLLDNNPVNCAFSIYDQPSQAQAGGEDGLIRSTGFQPFIASAPSFVFTGHPGQAVAEVESPAGAYFQFVGPTSSASFGGLTFDVARYGDTAPTATRLENGAIFNLGDLFTADTTIGVDGDFSAAVDPNGVSLAGLGFADEQEVDYAEWNWDTGMNHQNVPFTYIATNADPIVESGYVATLNPDLVAGTNNVNAALPRFEVGDVASVGVGEIVRNGTQLQAPLVQLPGGGRWQSRVVLTNTGNAERSYSIAIQTEDGVNVNPGTLDGVIPANKTVVLNVSDIVSFPGRARATLNVTVAAPNNQIQGLYQIVDVDNGGISNETMVRPGQN